jgi:hypothetical protein
MRDRISGSMPADPIYTQLLICERVLRDEDGLHSAIRIADLFTVVPKANVSPKDRPIVLSILFTAKYDPSDEDTHTAVVQLERPDGKILDIGESGPTKILLYAPDVPKAIHIAGRFGIVPELMGLHYIVIVLDGRQVERVPFMLREAETSTQ